MSPRIEPNVPGEVIEQLRKDLEGRGELMRFLEPNDYSTALWPSKNTDGVTVHTHGTYSNDLDSALEFYRNIPSVVVARERGEKFTLVDAKDVGLMHTTMGKDGKTKTTPVESGRYILVSQLALEASVFTGRA